VEDSVMDGKKSGAGDTRDVRTEEGAIPQGDEMGAPRISSDAEESQPLPAPDDPVSAVNPGARPSDYTWDEIEEGETPLGGGMDRLVDPSIRGERLSNNFDVLDLDGDFIEESEEPDFSTDPGTTDVIEAVEGEQTYFPPTDPVIRVSRNQDAATLGGFAGTSLEAPSEPEDHPLRLQNNDEELAERVRYALATDAYTADLNIDVEVEEAVAYLRGKVGSLEDIQQAEEVAGSVQGIDEVVEELEIV
jgi:hypothetical protein